MKKIFLTFMVLVNCVFASDELNIDSLFKKQIGLRSIISFSLLSTGNANSYSLYPNITIGGDPTIWNDTKQVFLTQTFIYTLTPKFDILISGGAEVMQDKNIQIFSQMHIPIKIA